MCVIPLLLRYDEYNMSKSFWKRQYVLVGAAIALAITLLLISYGEKNIKKLGLTDFSDATTFTFSRENREITVMLAQRFVKYDPENQLALPSRSFNSTNVQIPDLYDEQGDWFRFKFHDSVTDAYYALQPGGWIEVNLQKQDYIDSLLKEQVITSDDSTYITKVKCDRSDQRIGRINAEAVSCRTESFDGKMILDGSVTTNCYLNIGNNLYLAIEQDVKSISSYANMCEMLSNWGYYDVKVTEASL